MGRRSIKDLDKHFKQAQRGSKLTCTVCGKEKDNCEPVGERLICGQCRYEHAQREKERTNAQGRDFQVQLGLQLAAKSDPFAVAMIMVKAEVSFPEWKKAMHSQDGDLYAELRDKVWVALLEMGLLKNEAKEFAPPGYQG